MLISCLPLLEESDSSSATPHLSQHLRSSACLSGWALLWFCLRICDSPGNCWVNLASCKIQSGSGEEARSQNQTWLTASREHPAQKPDSSTWSYCNPGLVGSRSVNVSNLANGNTPLSLSISITVTLLSWSSLAQHEPEDKRGWIRKSAETLVPHLNVCLCTFCSSVTYWATTKADSVVKLSAVAAIWEYILSINLEHWR